MLRGVNFHIRIVHAFNTVGQLQGGDICIPSLDLTDDLSRVAAHIHAHGHAELLCIFFHQEILEAHAMSMIVIVGFGTRQRGDNHLTIGDNIV